MESGFVGLEPAKATRGFALLLPAALDRFAEFAGFGDPSRDDVALYPVSGFVKLIDKPKPDRPVV